VNVNPDVLPAVTADAVRSTVAGEHTAEGLVMVTVCVETFTVELPEVVHPAPEVEVQYKQWYQPV